MIDSMARPMTALLISPEPRMHEAVLAGEKRITIRVGHRDYQVGDRLMLCCHLEPWALRTRVGAVRHTWLADIRQEEWEADGFDSFDDMLEALEGYYGELGPDRNVTVIRWGALEELLVGPPALRDLGEDQTAVILDEGDIPITAIPACSASELVGASV